ncbi:MAG: leucyl/phenylalanyl-tRNA--protein transferase [Treponema sp.]|nr:leucyl/phenylalanyl-tRNA--protein transferase [Treponema sp.]
MRRRHRVGPDPNFPYLDEDERFPFPPPSRWGESVVAVGGNLSPGMILSAYEQGIFPWYGPGDPLIWQSPDPRMAIFPRTLHESKSMRKILEKGVFEIDFDRDFPAVIRACAKAERPGQDGTWILPEIIRAYERMAKLGWAHCAEARVDGRLVGGCYGLLIGRAFCGESMFSLQPNASKAAFLSLARRLFDDGAAFIDCQAPTEHLRSLGGTEIDRAYFLKLLGKAVDRSCPAKK